MRQIVCSKCCADLLVVGGGLTAFRALSNIDCKSNNVIMVSDGFGSSPFIHGISIPVDKSDSIEQFYEDLFVSSHFQCDKKLAHVLASSSLDVIDFVKKCGFDFNKNTNNEYELLKPLGMSHPRVLSIGNSLGKCLQDYLKEQIKDEINIIHGRIIKAFKKNGIFASVCYSNNEIITIYSKCVLVASGGFSRLYSFNTNSCDISGDSIASFYNIGAEVVDMEFVQFEPSVAIYPKPLVGKSVITTMVFEGAELFNNKHERFMFKYDSNGEKVNKDIMSKAIVKEILDGNGNEHGGVYFDASKVDKNVLETKYFSYFERYKNVGIDISKTPMEIAPGAHTTLGGLKIDENCCTNIDGLFAAGEVTGGIHGANRLGGCAGLETVVFGDIAGKSINKYLHEHKKTNFFVNNEAVLFASNLKAFNNEHLEKRKILSNILSNCFGVIRNVEKMEEGYHQLQQLQKEFEEAMDIGSVRLSNDIEVALLLAKSALNRNESVGCHYIENSQHENVQKYQIVIDCYNGLRRNEL